MTMAVSAYWHGLHPGYYLTFISAAVYLAVESAILPAGTGQRNGKARWVTCFLRVRANDYFGLGFELRDWQWTVRYWASLYWFGHVVLGLAAVVVGLLRIGRRRPARHRLKAGGVQCRYTGASGSQNLAGDPVSVDQRPDATRPKML